MNNVQLNLMFMVVAGLLLAGCSEEQATDSPSQKWRDMEVRIESRPSPPRAGEMNEFLVMVADGHGRPTYNLIVSMRANDQEQWKQGIEDGQMGVYRRAVKVEQGEKPVLQVQIRRDDTTDVLYFPLTMKP